MYIITEIQTGADGSVGTLVTTKENRNEADAEYYRVMAAAALSSVPCHACVVTSEEGFPILHGAYRHPAQPGPEPEEAGEAETGI